MEVGGSGGDGVALGEGKNDAGAERELLRCFTGSSEFLEVLAFIVVELEGWGGRSGYAAWLRVQSS